MDAPFAGVVAAVVADAERLAQHGERQQLRKEPHEDGHVEPPADGLEPPQQVVAHQGVAGQHVSLRLKSSGRRMMRDASLPHTALKYAR